MKSKLSIAQEYIKGLWDQNPVFKQVLGMCPTLAVTVSAINGIAMALATTFVLVFSSLSLYINYCNLCNTCRFNNESTVSFFE